MSAGRHIRMSPYAEKRTKSTFNLSSSGRMCRCAYSTTSRHRAPAAHLLEPGEMQRVVGVETDRRISVDDSQGGPPGLIMRFRKVFDNRPFRAQLIHRLRKLNTRSVGPVVTCCRLS